jgi:hypothetical protein
MEWRIAEKQKILANTTLTNNLLVYSNGTAVDVIVSSVPGLKVIILSAVGLLFQNSNNPPKSFDSDSIGELTH